MSAFGDSPARLDAIAKVTGRAEYAADRPPGGALHLALVSSPVGGGRIRRIDAALASAAPGVVGVMTHANAPRLVPADRLALLQDDAISHAGQPIALVAAGTAAQARAAARLVGVEIDDVPPVAADFDGEIAAAFAPSHVFGEPPDSVRGDPDAALARDDLVRVDDVYTTPTHLHSPMEPHAVTAWWDGDRVTVDTSTSGIFTARRVVAQAFGLPLGDVRVLCQFQGGGFGCKGSAWWPCLLLAVSAARLYRRPVRLVLTREEMSAAVGNRQRTHQRLAIAADRSGHLVAMRHEAISETGPRDYSEMTCFATRIIYRCPNVAVRHRLVRTRTPQPVPMRGPGEAPGSFALESALDALADTLAIDPVELRLRNAAERDPHADRPWSSHSLAECLRAAAGAFGWDRRGPARSMRDGHRRIGWGMASSYYPGFRAPAAARVRLRRDGAVLLECGNQEIGTGAATIMAQVAAAALGAPLEAIEVRYGDTELPETPMAAGAMSTASVVPAIEAAARALREQVLALAAVDPASPLHGAPPGAIAWRSPARLVVGDREDSAAALLERAGLPFAEAEGASGSWEATHSVNTFGACFAEVSIDPDLGEVRVSRLVAAYAAGRILNQALARGQLVGGLVGGIGMALHERLAFDRESGRVANAGLTDYLLPVHADVPELQVLLIEERDPHVPGGVKGVGMNGIVGTAAAIANAVHHAVGVRVRDLPITPEALLRAEG